MAFESMIPLTSVSIPDLSSSVERASNNFITNLVNYKHGWLPKRIIESHCIYDVLMFF